MFKNLKKLFALTPTLLVVAFLVLAPFSPTFEYQKAEAGPNIVQDPWNLAQNTISAAANTITSFATNELFIKEYVLDGLAWTFINAVLEEMIRSITAWVNAGFPDGGPAFLQDLGGFLLNIADGVAGDFILGTQLGFLCSPFQLDIRIALSAQYLNGGRGSDGYQPQCRITGILENIRNFTVNVDGSVDLQAAYDSRSFAAGGWAWWLGTTQEQENNVYGAYASAQAALSVALRNAKGEEIKLLEFGEGFLSRRVCNPPGSNNCSIVTPGAVIEQQLNNALAGGQQRLTVADEINELIGALLSALVREALGGIMGMLGLSEAGGYGESGQLSYLEAMAYDTAFGGYSTMGSSTVAMTSMNRAGDYTEVLDDIISAVDAEERALNAANATYGTSTINLTLPTQLTTARANAITERARIQTIVSQISALSVQLASATSTEARNAINQQVLDLDRQIPSTATISTYQQQNYYGLQPVRDSFRRSLDAAIARANSTSGGGN